jgi:Zn-dependent peptidase ImmA (M78 family)
MARTRRPCPIAVGHARGLLRDLRIRAADEIDVELIAGHCGFLIRTQPMRSAEGRLLVARSMGVIAVAESAYASSKWRFVIAHELGHAKRHRQLNQLDICTDSDLRSAYTGRESEANDFASELLMPEEFFKSRCDIDRPSLRELRELAAEFGTSVTSTAIRFVQFTSEACAVVHSTRGKVDWVAPSETFRVFVPRGLTLTAATYAGDLHAGNAAPDYRSQVDGSGWSDSARADEIDLFEHSTRVAAGVVLTFLWHPFVD